MVLWVRRGRCRAHFPGGSAVVPAGGRGDVRLIFMGDITTAVSGLATVFASFAALAVLVAGFWLGRKWLGRAMGDGGGWSAADEAEFERQGREVGLANDMRGTGDGWGDGGGSGLHRGRR